MSGLIRKPDDTFAHDKPHIMNCSVFNKKIINQYSSHHSMVHVVCMYYAIDKNNKWALLSLCLSSLNSTYIDCCLENIIMSCIARKPVFGAVGQKLEILDLGSRGMVLSVL